MGCFFVSLRLETLKTSSLGILFATLVLRNSRSYLHLKTLFKDYIKFYVNMVFDPLKSPYYKVICVRKAPDQPSNYKPDIHWNCYWKDSFYFDAENEPLTMPISTTEAPQMCSYMGKCRGVLYVSVTYFVLMC
ncbi:hypothetical protein ES288_D13G200400v1 [Gossypium darwinii]|uniref:Uncharacterized protein n=1 Tax=Gossypium darwinii TaxID=34276 RepID=A0A5D1ZZY8_GOSDA|nr:hypothetical protein ES288_D13G200400v1 [Gossypium darwinii]